MYLLEAVIRIILLYTIDIDTMVYISIAAPVVFTSALAVWACWHVKRVHRKCLSFPEPGSDTDSDVDSDKTR